MPTYKQALEYLNSFTNYEKIGFNNIEKEFDLMRLRKVLKKLGQPHRDYRAVHVAGTKGKGSICTFTSSILEEAGHRVGLFTSPHLSAPEERIKVNGKAIGKTDLVRTLEHLKKYLGPAAGREFTFFEVYTLMAILYFSMKKVDFAVFETGMGGRLDATNVIDAEVCGIAPVSYDHTQVLGGTLEKIAQEKAAIIKPGSCCVSSPQRASVLRVIAGRCRREGAALSVVEKDITYRPRRLDEEGSLFDIHGMKKRYEKCRTMMPGEFQITNCATAVGLCEKVLKEKDLTEDAVKKGVERAFIPGRLEALCRDPLVVIDGAQNAASAQELKYSVEQIFRYDRLILLLGISQGKDIKGVCRHLAPLADEIVLTRASSERAEDPYLIRGYIKGKQIKVTTSAKEALGMALHLAGEKDMILATGSFFLIGEIRNLINVNR
ncbi:bifunctional folylpolyglutamate synthase/dihydrofolate synthase [Candidatus Omnitrophota bacterium]